MGFWTYPGMFGTQRSCTASMRGTCATWRCPAGSSGQWWTAPARRCSGQLLQQRGRRCTLCSALATCVGESRQAVCCCSNCMAEKSWPSLHVASGGTSRLAHNMNPRLAAFGAPLDYLWLDSLSVSMPRALQVPAAAPAGACSAANRPRGMGLHACAGDLASRHARILVP